MGGIGDFVNSYPYIDGVKIEFNVKENPISVIFAEGGNYSGGGGENGETIIRDAGSVSYPFKFRNGSAIGFAIYINGVKFNDATIFDFSFSKSNSELFQTFRVRIFKKGVSTSINIGDVIQLKIFYNGDEHLFFEGEITRSSYSINSKEGEILEIYGYDVLGKLKDKTFTGDIINTCEVMHRNKKSSSDILTFLLKDIGYEIDVKEDGIKFSNPYSIQSKSYIDVIGEILNVNNWELAVDFPNKKIKIIPYFDNDAQEIALGLNQVNNLVIEQSIDDTPNVLILKGNKYEIEDFVFKHYSDFKKVYDETLNKTIYVYTQGRKVWDTILFEQKKKVLGGKVIEYEATQYKYSKVIKYQKKLYPTFGSFNCSYFIYFITDVYKTTSILGEDGRYKVEGYAINYDVDKDNLKVKKKTIINFVLEDSQLNYFTSPIFVSPFYSCPYNGIATKISVETWESIGNGNGRYKKIEYSEPTDFSNRKYSYYAHAFNKKIVEEREIDGDEIPSAKIIKPVEHVKELNYTLKNPQDIEIRGEIKKNIEVSHLASLKEIKRFAKEKMRQYFGKQTKIQFNTYFNPFLNIGDIIKLEVANEVLKLKIARIDITLQVNNGFTVNMSISGEKLVEELI